MTTMDSADVLLQTEPSARHGLRYRQRHLDIRLTLAERRFLLRTVDVVLVNAALVIALLVWSDLPISVTALLANFKWLVTLAVVWLIMGATLDVYDLARSASPTQSILYTGLAALLTGLIYLAIPWLTPPLGRRMQAFGFVGLAVASVAAWRALYAWFFFQPAFQQRVLLVGDGAISRSLVRELNATPSEERPNPFSSTGYRVVGFVADPSSPAIAPSDDTLIQVPAQNLVHEARCLDVDEIIVTDESSLSSTLHEAMMDCRELGLRVTSLSEAYERLTARLPVEYAARDLSILAGAPDNSATRLYQAAKRVIDVVIALLGVSLVGFLAPWIALGNALTSPGPLFYRQHRVGQGGRPFALIKFRTMIPQAESKSGAQWAAADDQRVTPVGRWLRKTRLDEIPQFINVLRGEMSVVGPRPERPQFVGELIRSLPLYRARHAVRPGITGWAQICYHYGNSVEDSRIKLEYDLYYVKHAGAFLDTLIFLQTMPVMLKFKGY